VLLPVYIHYHGGGFLYGSLSSEDVGCARIVNALPVIVVNVCYRHTPQFRYPTQRNDAFDSYDWTVLNIKSFGGDPDNIIVGGISAGANLAAAIVLRENLKAKEQSNTASTANKTELKHIKGQVLVIPWLIIQEYKYPYELFTSKEKSSRVQCADAAVLPDEVIKWFVENLKLDSTQSRTDPFLDVGLVTDKEVEGMPKTFFVIAGRDPLRDDGLLYARKLHRNGYVFI
jgi:acetyl esterase/lipase